jgi:uncharacterized glyoxalase superfamily protein PhnB
MTPRLDAIGITTRDIAQSFAFYRHLGFEIPAGQETEPHAEITLPNGLRFMWDTVELTSSLHPGYVHAPNHNVGAFLCANAAEVNSKYEELLAVGGRGVKAPWDAFWGQRYAQVSDPDGHVLDLFAPL